jgi:hypothetical protein
MHSFYETGWTAPPQPPALSGSEGRVRKHSLLTEEAGASPHLSSFHTLPYRN